ncbi:MAG: zinc ribbon domain-containing protein [Solirubrobacterales bacterium]
MDSHTSATTPAATTAQPHDGPAAAAPPGTGAATPPPGAPTASPAAPGATASPSATASAAPATAATAAATAPSDPAAAEPEANASEPHAGFGSRGRLRRRARFLRKARELAYRDLGGLVFSLHRFGQRNDALVLAKLSTLSRIDAELRTLEDSLGERRPVTVLREAGITACPRCAAIHSGEDRFCPSCGLSMSRRSDLPIAAAATGGVAQPPTPGAPTPTPTPTPAPAPAPAAPPPAGSPASPSAAPATEQHAAIAAASGARAQPHAAPQPATQVFDAIAPAGGDSAGRSPSPPRTGQSQSAEPAREDDDQPTEIIRPPAPGS